MSDDSWGAATDEAHRQRRMDDRRQLRATPVHPSDVSRALLAARVDMEKLIEAAENRGDEGGADAWRLALEAIEHADRTVSEMRSKQDWDSKPTDKQKIERLKRKIPEKAGTR